MMPNIHEKLNYLLDYIDYTIEQSIYDVLSDSEDDPHYSAVTTHNLIKCYLDVTHEYGQNKQICTPEDYLRAKCFSPEEISLLDTKRIHEATNYHGIQY